MDDYDEQLRAFKSLSSAFFQPAVVLNAIELGVFTVLGEQSLTAEDVAERLGSEPSSTKTLLAALASFGYVQREGDEFANTPFGARALVAGSPDYEGDSALMSLWFMRRMGRVADPVRKGESQETFEDAVSRSPEQARVLVRAMDQVARGFVAELTEHVSLEPGQHVLDVGGAAGSYAMALVEANPGAQATVLELPHAAAEADRIVDERGFADRVRVLPGDFRSRPLGSDYDVVFCSNVFHLLPPDSAEQLVRRCADALRAGGRLVVKDMLGDPSGETEGMAVYSTLMLVISRGGALHDEQTYARWFESAGLARPRRIDCWERSSLLIGTKET